MSLPGMSTFPLLFALTPPPEGGSVSPWVQLIPIAFILVIFYFIILLPMRRRQKKVDEFLKNLKVGDKVITTGGLFGSITRLGEQSLQIQIAEKIRVEIARNAIVGYQGEEPVAGEGARQ